MEKAKDIFMYSLAALTMALLFSTIYLILTKSIPSENEKMAYMAVGLALGWGTMIMSYFYGSSKGSADKSTAMNKQLPNKGYSLIPKDNMYQGKFSDGKLTPLFATEKEVHDWVAKIN